MQSYDRNSLLKVHTKITRSQDRCGNLSMIKGWNKIPAKGDTLPFSVCGSAAPVHHLEDTYTPWAESLGAGPGRPCTHTSIPQLLCDQRQASDRRAARSRMPTEAVNLRSLLSSWHTILRSWESQCQMHSLRRPPQKAASVSCTLLSSPGRSSSATFPPSQLLPSQCWIYLLLAYCVYHHTCQYFWKSFSK